MPKARIVLSIIVDTDQLLVNARKNNKSTGGLDEEFRTIKRSYHRECLKKHPDKGGSEAEFVRLNDVWENVREMYERKTIGIVLGRSAEASRTGGERRRRKRRRTTTTTTTKASKTKKKKKGDAQKKTTSGWSYRSYKFYEEAAAYDDPEYRVELARSNRSRCVATARPRLRTRGRKD